MTNTTQFARAQDILQGAKNQILADPMTYKHRHGSYESVVNTIDGIVERMGKPASQNPNYACLPLLSCMLVELWSIDDGAYATLVRGIANGDERACTLSTLEGIILFHTMINGLADDHDYALDRGQAAPALAYQGSLDHFEATINPIHLLTAFQQGAHRGLFQPLG